MSLDGDSVLTNMTASELTDGTNNGRRRQSADTDRIVSSTPYWNNPRQSTEDSTPYFTDARSNAQKGHGLAQSLVNGSSGSGNSHHSRGETSRRCDLYRRTSNERRLSGGNVLEEPRHRRHSRENRNSRERRPSDGYNNSGYHRTPRE
ncbi:uncharacterized protein LOC129564873 [Sitodiplosis mosellana]|uniref:uncharacterized protein LOC129564873 n=1 Tax=Sitodiplosis mosellana TaxID=263140 RepID=UPI0024451155|nr:uncharacterized protein LOC129564873 [Sitodiplosis mosellana]